MNLKNENFPTQLKDTQSTNYEYYYVDASTGVCKGGYNSEIKQYDDFDGWTKQKINSLVFKLLPSQDWGFVVRLVENEYSKKLKSTEQGCELAKKIQTHLTQGLRIAKGESSEEYIPFDPQIFLQAPERQANALFSVTQAFRSASKGTDLQVFTNGEVPNELFTNIAQMAGLDPVSREKKESHNKVTEQFNNRFFIEESSAQPPISNHGTSSLKAPVSSPQGPKKLDPERHNKNKSFIDINVPDNVINAGNICFRILCEIISTVVGAVLLGIAFGVLNVATAGTAAGIALAVAGGIAFFGGSIGLAVDCCKNHAPGVTLTNIE